MNKKTVTSLISEWHDVEHIFWLPGDLVWHAITKLERQSLMLEEEAIPLPVLTFSRKIKAEKISPHEGCSGQMSVVGYTQKFSFDMATVAYMKHSIARVRTCVCVCVCVTFDVWGLVH